MAVVSRRAHLLGFLGRFLRYTWGFYFTVTFDVSLVKGKLPCRVLHQPCIVALPIYLTTPAPGLTGHSRPSVKWDTVGHLSSHPG